jgi:hypothetical protein
MRGLRRRAGVNYPVLTPNMEGFRGRGCRRCDRGVGVRCCVGGLFADDTDKTVLIQTLHLDLRCHLTGVANLEIDAPVAQFAGIFAAFRNKPEFNVGCLRVDGRQ